MEIFLLLAAEPGMGWGNTMEILSQVEASSASRQRAAGAERDQNPMDAALAAVERARESLENSKECKDGEESSLCLI